MKKKILAGVAIAAVAALAAMGLVFCWSCPDLILDAKGVVSHFKFNQQLAWNGLGIVSFGFPLLIGWKRLLKAAPFVFAGWIALWCIAHIGPCVNGAYSYAKLGCISVKVWSVFPFVFALLTAWVAKRHGVRTKWIMLAACLSVVVAMCVQFFMNANRMQRVFSWWFGGGEPYYNTGRALLQMEMEQIFSSAHWFSGADGDLKYLPFLFTSGAPSAAAWLFGKWFVAFMMVLFAVFASCLVWVYNLTPNREKRLFVLIWGAGVIVPAINGPLQCLGIVPFYDICMPMISFGGTEVLMTWMGASVFSSICMDEV